MKVAIISPTFPPYAGGIGNVAAAHAKVLHELGCDVTVFTPLYRPVQEELKSLRIIRLQPLVQHGNAAVVPSLIKQLFGYDIIHLHYPFFGGAELLWLAAKKIRRRGGKIIIHYHMDVVGTGALKMIFAFHNRFLLPKIIRAADRVVVTSLDYARHSNIASLITRQPEKYIEIPNGVDSAIFKPGGKDAELLTRHSIAADDRVVLFVGGLDKAHYFKGIENLIEALSRLKRAAYTWKLLIVGAGELLQRYADWADQLGIGVRTIFTGYVPNDMLPSYYRAADVAVLASVDKSEAFGLTLVEAMSCGKPVIASNLAGVRSVVKDGVTGLLCAVNNPDDLAAKINYMLTHTDAAAQYGATGRQKVEQQFDWQLIGKELLSLYNNV